MTDHIEELYRLLDKIVDDPASSKKTFEYLDQCTSDMSVTDDAYKTALQNRQGESPLHSAVKKFRTMSKYEKKTVRLLMERFPEMVTSGRTNTKYEGQTPFHMSVCKGSTWLVGTLIDHVTDKDTLLTMRATGEIFRNTVMMAEIPLSIAALTFNIGMVELLLTHGATIDGTNNHGDNVCHTLIRYAYLYPDKLAQVTEMFRHLLPDSNEGKGSKLFKKIWVMHNNEGLTPLRLAAKLGQHELFTFIMDLEAYCHLNSDDGMFDIKVYDITEIDAIASLTIQEAGGRERNSETEQKTDAVMFHSTTANYKHFKSVLMLMIELEPSSAFPFLMLPPLRRIIDEKWSKYRAAFYASWIFYTIFTSIMIWYSIERAQQEVNSSTGFNTRSAPNFKHKLLYSPFVTTFSIIAFIFSLFVLLLEVLRMGNGRMPYTTRSFTNPYGNGWFRVFLAIMALLLITDLFAAIWSSVYENYCLLLAMILACFCHIFFIRALRPFCFFTVLITKVIIGDMFRFFVIIGIELLAFTTAIYMAIQGSEVIFDTNFSHYGRVLFSMLTLMVGLGDTADLYKTRHPELAVAIFVTFIIFTTLLMINSLIAMISDTCSELVNNVGNVNALDRHWHLQRLSLIMFIESVLPDRFIFNVGDRRMIRMYSNVLKRRKMMPRFLLQVRSMKDENEVYPEEDDVEATWGPQSLLRGPRSLFRTLAMTVANTQRHRHSKRRASSRDKRNKVNEVVNAFQEANGEVVHGQNVSKDETHLKGAVRGDDDETQITPFENVKDNPDVGKGSQQNHRLDIYVFNKENRQTLDSIKLLNSR